MNQKLSLVKIGFLLFLITIAIFLGMYFIFSTNGKISDADYFNYSALINCFVLPALYAGFGFFAAVRAVKVQPLKFGKVFIQAFVPQVIGGFLSLGFIFIFLNTTGSWAEDSLQRGWFELTTSNPNPEFMEKNKDFVSSMGDMSINMFTWKVFFISFSLILFFYFLISIIFAIFLKNRRI